MVAVTGGSTGNMWEKDSKSNGTIHQLSTCDQRFGGLMIVRFNDHRPPQHPRWDTIVPEEG